MRRPKKEAGTTVIKEPDRPRCLETARKGVSTSCQFAKMMADLMSDVIEGRISPQVANATVNAGGKLLKVVEMQYKYGKSNDGAPPQELSLIGAAS